MLGLLLGYLKIARFLILLGLVIQFQTCLGSSGSGSQEVINSGSILRVEQPIKYDNLKDKRPTICRTLKAQEFDIPEEGRAPYEIIVARIAPSVYEVIIQGIHGELFTDFVLAVESPYQGEFSTGRYDSFGCDVTSPNKQTLIRASESSRLTLKRQAVAHFYPRKASGVVIFRGSVYSNETTCWILENSSLQFPM